MTVDTAWKAASVLERLYAAGFSDPVIDTVLQKAVENQANRDEVVLRDLERDMVDLENQYATSSDVFYKQWQVGELPDTADLMEWSALYQMAQRIRERLNLLRGKTEL